MRLREILDKKGHEVYKTTPETLLIDAVASLVGHNCGSLLVCNGDELVGIITERDVLRICDSAKTQFPAKSVAECMTTKMKTGTPEDEVAVVMGVMTQRRIRHLPILEGGKLVGIVSIGDVVKAQFDMLALENHYLKEYIQS